MGNKKLQWNRKSENSGGNKQQQWNYKENGLLIAQPKEQLFAKLKQLERSLRELS